MANKKISELQSRTPALSDLMLVGDPSSGYSYKCTVTALATIIETDIADGYVTIGTTQTISGAKTFSNNLTLTSVANATTTQTKFLTLNASNVVNYRTGAEVLADIGGQGTITLTTTGTSGAATLVGSTLNIPQYQSVLTNPVTGTGTTNYVTKWTSSSAVGNSQIIDNGTAIGIGTAPSNAYLLSVAGIYRGVGVGNAARIELYDTQSGGATFYISPQESLGVTSLGTYGAFPILFVTNSAERIRISSAGDVTISTIANATVDTDKFLVSDSGVIKYRTGSEVLSDIGAASSSSISGTTNYIPKFTSSSAIGNSIMSEGSGAITVGGNIISSNFYIPAGSAGTYGLANLSAAIQTYSGSVSPTNSILFYTNGSERMRLDASGNLGINTSSPSYKLDVAGSGAFSGGLRTTAGDLRSINVGSDTPTSGSFITVVNASDSKQYLLQLNASYGLDFWNFNGSSFSKRATLTADGNLGLGVTPSAWSLGKVIQVGSTTSVFNDANGSTYFGNNFNYNSNFLYLTSSYALSYVQQVDGKHVWNTAPSGTAGNAISFTQAMTLDASGRLGIGVTNPSGLLQLNGSIATSGDAATFTIKQSSTTYTNGIYLERGGERNGYYMYIGGGSDALTFRRNYFGTQSDVMSLTRDGNVGIGTTSPTGTGWNANSLAVQAYKNDTDGALFRATSSNTDFVFSAGNDLAYIATLGADPIAFYTDLTERMRITSAGNVGIGTTSPNQRLTVGVAQTANTVMPVLKLTTTGTYSGGGSSGAGASVEFGQYHDTYPNWVLGQISGIRSGASWDGALLFYTNNGSAETNKTEQMRITSGGELLINTTSDAGDYKLQVNGNTYTNGSLTTAAPSGGNAASWKLGERVASSGLTLNDTQYIQLDIAGTLYTLATVNLP